MCLLKWFWWFHYFRGLSKSKKSQWKRLRPLISSRVALINAFMIVFVFPHISSFFFQNQSDAFVCARLIYVWFTFWQSQECFGFTFFAHCKFVQSMLAKMCNFFLCCNHWLGFLSLRSFFFLFSVFKQANP